MKQLARRIASSTMLAKHWITWALIAFGLWALGTATSIVIGGGMLVLGFGGLAVGLVASLVWRAKCHLDARKLAREGQLVTGVATAQRSRETFGGELRETFDALLGEHHHSIVFSIGFIRHEVRVAADIAYQEGEECSVLVRPGSRHALAFDRHGRGHVGELLRIG